MYYDSDENVATCPKCNRMITNFDVKIGRCVVCDLDISAIGKDLSMIQEEVMLETFASEIKKSDKKLDYYKTALNILKAYLVNCVCVLRTRRTVFYYISECEIRDMVFALVARKKEIYMEFNTVPKYPDIYEYTKDELRLLKLGTVKSYYRTTNFENMMDLAMSMYNTKKNKNRNSIDKSKIAFYNRSKTSFYRYR